MTIIEWKPECTSGLQEIDEEQQRLIDSLSDLQLAMMFGKGSDEVKMTILGLAAYASCRFPTEEESLQGEAEFMAHKEQHDLFLRMLTGFEQDMIAHDRGLSLRVMHFLNHWIETHVKTMDQQHLRCIMCTA
jgi:hemerythrin-like metal-binding protein